MLKHPFTLAILIISFVLSLIATPVSAQITASDQVSESTQKLLKKGRKLSIRGKSKRAVKLYENALKEETINEADRNAIKKKLAGRYIHLERGLEAIELVKGVNFQKEQDRSLIQKLVKQSVIHERYETALDWIEIYGTGYFVNSYQDYQSRVRIYGLTGRQGDVIRTIQSYAKNHPNNKSIKEAYDASFETQNREAVLIGLDIPFMPSNAERSGHCVFSVEVTASGRVKEILETQCTEAIFEAPSIQAVKNYIYLPKLENGISVETIDDDVRLTYKLMNKDGKIVPEKEQ